MATHPGNEEWQPENGLNEVDPIVEANPADLAEQRLTAEPDHETDPADLESAVPAEANPADVVEQRQSVPVEDEPLD